MKYLEMTDEDRRRQDERRAAPPRRRREARIAGVLAGVVVAALLGWCTAAGVGLTTAAEHVPEAVPVTAPSAETDWAEPAMRRTLSVPAPAPHPTTPPAPGPTGAAAVAPSAVPQLPDPEPRPQPQAQPEVPPPSSLAASPPPALPVRKGDDCPVLGTMGVTPSGTTVMCTASHGHGRARWRPA